MYHVQVQTQLLSLKALCIKISSLCFRRCELCIPTTNQLRTWFQ